MSKDRSEYFKEYMKNPKHKKLHIKSVKKCQDRYNKNGKCCTHPSENLVSGTKCQKCLDNMNQRGKQRKENNICKECSSFCVPNKIRCSKHLFLELLRNHKIIYKQAVKILQKQNYICPLSNRKLVEGINTSVDHKIHKCNSGTDDIKNIRFTDKDTNLFRKDMTDKELFDISRDIYFTLRKKYEK